VRQIPGYWSTVGSGAVELVRISEPVDCWKFV
jgi:hypothetical protein